MYVVIKKKFRKTGPTVFGGTTPGYFELSIDRMEESLDGIESGETFFECKIKK